jgi:hypothetical protein
VQNRRKKSRLLLPLAKKTDANNTKEKQQKEILFSVATVLPKVITNLRVRNIISSSYERM